MVRQPLFAAVTALVFTGSLMAQIPPRSDTTNTPLPNKGHDYIHAPLETVNPANGALSIRIAVPLPPSRGSNLPFSFAYDTNGVNYLETAADGSPMYWSAKGPLTQGGWSYSVPTLSVTGIAYTVSGWFQDQNCELVTNYVFQDAGGNRHNLFLATAGVVQPLAGGDCNGSGGYQQVTTGGEGPILATTTGPWDQSGVQSVIVTDGDGATYSFPAALPMTGAGPYDNSTVVAWSVTDRNGNDIYQHGLSISGFGHNPDTISVSGLAVPYSVSWTTQTPSFGANFVQEPGSRNCNQTSGQSGPTGSYPVVSSIALPNGQQYVFSYDAVYGVVNRVTYPTGGYVRYVWGLNQDSTYGRWVTNLNVLNVPASFCNFQYDTPAILDRYVSFDGVTEVQHQQFSYSTNWAGGCCGWASKSTTITTTDPPTARCRTNRSLTPKAARRARRR